MNRNEPPYVKFEERLRSAPIRELPISLRLSILANATAEPPAVPKRWWQLPRPILWTMAACWVAIIGLSFTMPQTLDGRVVESPPKTKTVTPKDQIAERALILAWVMRGRTIANQTSF